MLTDHSREITSVEDAAVTAASQHTEGLTEDTRPGPPSGAPGDGDGDTTVADQIAAPAGARSSGFLAPLRIANVRRLLAGQTVSRFGDQFYLVALPWLVLRVSDAPIALSLVVGAAAAALGVFTLVGGVLADRLGPRRLMLSADALRLCIVSGLGAAVLLGSVPLWALIVLAALLGAGGGLFYPASVAMIPHLVPTDDLQAANGFDQLTLQTSNFVGPSVAGVVLAATRLAFGFVVDALSFAVSVLSLLAIRMPVRPTVHSTVAASSDEGVGAGGNAGTGGMGEALRFLRGQPFLTTLLSVSLIGNFAVGGLPEVALPLLLKHWVGLTDGPRALGIVIGGFGLGSVVGALIASVATKIPHKSLVAVLVIMPTCALIAYVPYLGGVYGAAGAFAATGLLLAISNVLLITVLQRFIPLHLMGRVMSIAMLGSFVGTPLSIFAYGGLASIVPDVSYLFIAGGALLGFGCLFSLTRKVIWQTA